jgi:hypothetical protein
MLQMGQWSFVLMPEAGRIKMKVSEKGQTHLLELQIRNDSQFILGMLIYKRKCNPEYRQTMSDFMNKQNFRLAIGGLEMDPDTGLCRFRHSVDVEKLTLTPLFVNNFMKGIAGLGCKLWTAVEAVMNGESVNEACRLIE